MSRDQYAHVLSTFKHTSCPKAPEFCLARFDELKSIGLGAFTKKHDPYWDIPLNENLPQPVIDLLGSTPAGEGDRFQLDEPGGKRRRQGAAASKLLSLSQASILMRQSMTDTEKLLYKAMKQPDPRLASLVRRSRVSGRGGIPRVRPHGSGRISLTRARLASGLWALGLERPEADRGIGKGGVRVVHCTDRPLLRSGGDGENRAQNELEKLEAVAAVWQTSRSSPDKLFGVLVIDEDCRDAGMTIEHRMGQTGISYIDDRHFDLVGKSSVA